MPRLLVVVAALVLAGTLPGPRAQAPSAVHLVIDAVASDATGAPVMDLTPKEIEVWVAGYRVPIASLRTVTPRDRNGRAIVLVLDDVTVPPALVPRVREIARRFIDRMVPGDRLAILTFDGRQRGEFSEDRKRLLESLDQYSMPVSAMRTIDGLGEQVFGVVGSVARQVTEDTPTRNTIVAIGSGGLFDRPIPPPFVGRELRPEWTDAMRAVAMANANFYVIDPGGLSAVRTFGGDAGFARETGGYAFVATNDFEGAVDQIMREAGNHYLLEVADPPAMRKAPLRKLDVRTSRKGVTIRARRAVPGTEQAR